MASSKSTKVAVKHEGIIDLIQDDQTYAVLNKITGEIHWLEEGPTWTLHFHENFSYVSAEGKPSLWVSSLLKHKVVKQDSEVLMVSSDNPEGLNIQELMTDPANNQPCDPDQLPFVCFDCFSIFCFFLPEI